MAKLYYLLKEHRISILLFLMAGGLSALINFGSFGLLWNVLGLSYQVSISVAYVLSVVVHFMANRNITFKSHDINVVRQLPKYAVMVLINYIVTVTIVHIIVENFHASPYIGIVFAIGCTVLTGYLLSRYWVFRVVNLS